MKIFYLVCEDDIQTYKEASRQVGFSTNIILQQAQLGRIRFASGRVRGKFSFFLSSKVSFGYTLVSFMCGAIVLVILKWYGCVEYQFMLGCQIHGK